MLTPLGHQQEFLSFLSRSSRKGAGDFHHSLVLRMLDDPSNAQIRPHFQTASSATGLLFHFFPKCPHNTFGIRRKPIGTDQQGVHALAARTHVLEETINEPVIALLTDRPSQP